MTTTTLSHDLIGREVEFNHPETSRLMVGTINNTFKNGKVQVRPHYTVSGNTLTPFEFNAKTGFTAPLVNVRFARCELRETF